MGKQKTLHEKWASESKEENGIRFHEAPEGAKPVELKGFTEEEMKRMLGEEEYAKYKQRQKAQVDEIDEV